MTIEKTVDEKKLTLKVEGRLDTTTAPELEAEFAKIPDQTNEIVIDFEGLEYISSAGLRMLLSLQKKMMKKGGMKLIGVNEDVNDVFEVTGFDEILTYEKR